MKVAEALSERGDLDQGLKKLADRIKRSARYCEGEEPPEDPQDLLDQARAALARREDLVRRINHTNAVTRLPSGMTVTAAMALRDRLGAERRLLADTADAGTGNHDAYYGTRRRSELPAKTDLPVRGLRSDADQIAKQFRGLDAQLQAANWITELIED